MFDKIITLLKLFIIPNPVANNPIILVDFDGVIHSYTSGWCGVDVIPDDPVPGAIEFLEANLPDPDDLDLFGTSWDIFRNENRPVVRIYSSRSKSYKGRRAMKNWLIKHGLHPGYIRDDILKFPITKPPAFLTIDDRALCFEGEFPSVNEMMAFKPWYKRAEIALKWAEQEAAKIKQQRSDSHD